MEVGVSNPNLFVSRYAVARGAIIAAARVNVFRMGFMRFFLTCIRGAAEGVEIPSQRGVHRIHEARRSSADFSRSRSPLHITRYGLLHRHDLIESWREMNNPDHQGAAS